MKKSSVKSKKIEIILKVHSLHASLPTPVAAELLFKSKIDLAKKLQAQYGKARVTLERQKTFPVDPGTILLTVGIFIGTQIAGKAVDEVIDLTLDWAKKKLKKARVTKYRKSKMAEKAEKGS
jgi:hypothetical protein